MKHATFHHPTLPQ